MGVARRDCLGARWPTLGMTASRVFLLDAHFMVEGVAKQCTRGTVRRESGQHDTAQLLRSLLTVVIALLVPSRSFEMLCAPSRLQGIYSMAVGIGGVSGPILAGFLLDRPNGLLLTVVLGSACARLLVQWAHGAAAGSHIGIFRSLIAYLPDQLMWPCY